MKKMEITLKDMQTIAGGTGPLNYPYGSCDPPMKETGPLGTGPLGTGPLNSCDPPMKETGPLGTGPLN
ncbi:hypothetical protein [Anaerovibrio sp. JC8]|uniref:hypothetical protein n=1 Tax=Anaerovibrio sp. JC8 TaxID=1240085 RepID=UPI000A108B6B|nr:hypothetical protein [Anaerovibrio sp. JC8]